jgi:hypothetical protein
MKTRVTFRVAPELAESLRHLENQTQFVEQALREALREKCRVCGGSGRVSDPGVRVPNYRPKAPPPLTGYVGVQLRRIAAHARHAAATRAALARRRGGALGFVVARGVDVLLRGTLRGEAAHIGN